MFFGKRFSGYRKGLLSGLDVLVLSIIKNNDGISGYEIIQKINKKFKDLWTASAGTIYPLLNRLAEKRLVGIKEITENNRQKKIYRITEIGKEALKKVLESDLEPSINTLGDFIRTIIKASIPNEKVFERMTHCFPFHRFTEDIKIDETDYSIHNIEHINAIIRRLMAIKRNLSGRLEEVDKKIRKYSEILEKIKTERNKNAKTIEIIDDNEEFDNF